MKKRFNDGRNVREMLIDTEHLAIGIDDTWLGINVYTVLDLNLLIEWWNMTIRFAADNITREIKDEKFQALSSALWIRINDLHPKYRLQFDDITKPELLKKA